MSWYYLSAKVNPRLLAAPFGRQRGDGSQARCQFKNYMSKTIRQPKSDNPLSDPRRLYTCSFKASWWQTQEIKRLAQECGEDMSTYVVMRALNYRPRLRLTPEERAALDNILDCRRDIRRFFNALEGMNKTDRQVMFCNHAFMREWLHLLMTQHDRIAAFLDRVEAPNEKPQSSITKTDQQ